ncbi:ABC transporter permease [Leucobacter sp. UCMA 4100]|uniref:methionine ABC transporter permease n=1 Tax=Leucobacter sp. UCMA 4100 TaxID=2810534 RepID=UPI0022EB0511|nr:methionine ABC transporter permease [Leucobacter sp. UCMA 4100]MDA3147033.1 ABC transporter permease [Leucobacter sp. UCMA 4100]
MIDAIVSNWPALGTALIETGIMVFFALLAAVLLGLPLGTVIFLTGKGGIRKNRFVWLIADSYVTVVRAFPFLLFIVFLIPFTRLVLGTSFGVAGGTFPLLFVAVAIFARLTEQILREIPPGILRAAQAMGASTLQIVTRFLLSEGRPGLVYALTSATVTLVSYSTVLGVVGGGGIGDFAMRHGYQRYDWTLMYAAVILTVGCVLIIQFVGNRISAALDKR